MKNLWAKWLALGLVFALLIVMQGPKPGETKKIKIKKVLKELKKLKKYGYLLASQRKKLYAIPFPMPLPIFVKRQHIYTSIPIIPRYVQHPHQHSSQASSAAYSAPSSHSSPSSSLASASSETSSAASPPPYESSMMGYHLPDSIYAPSKEPGSDYGPSASGYGFPTRTRAKKHNQGQQQDLSSYLSAIPTSSKYLSQLANALGQSTLGGSTTNKDILTKIMSGQAKILAPTSLLSAIKSPTSALMNLYQQQTHSATSSASPSSSSGPSSLKEFTHDDQDARGNTDSSTSGSSSSSSSSSEDTAPSASGAGSSSSSSKSTTSGEANKPSASEVHKSRFKPYMIRTPYGRIPAVAANVMGVLNPAMATGMMPNPFALMGAPQSPALMQARIPMLQPANQLAADYMPMSWDPQAYPMSQLEGAGSSDHMEPQSSDTSEKYASNENQQDNQLARYRAVLAMQQRRQALLRLALLREREEAARHMESRDQHIPLGRLHEAQLLHLYRRQQELRQLQHLRQLQQHHQRHQAQLAQNTIDR